MPRDQPETNTSCRQVHFVGHRIICYTNHAIVALSKWMTVAPTLLRASWCTASPQRSVPSIAVPRKLDFNSMVVKLVAPSGKCAMVA